MIKVCSDLNKPNGQYILQPNQTEILNFVRKLSIRKACGIGNVSEQMLNGIGRYNNPVFRELFSYNQS